jgi:predicted O-methyltransferase YrrM
VRTGLEPWIRCGLVVTMTSCGADAPSPHARAEAAPAEVEGEREAGPRPAKGKGKGKPKKNPPREKPAEPEPAPEPEPEPEPEDAPHFGGRGEVETTVSGEGEGPYRFTAYWHKRRAADWDKVLAPYKGRERLSYLEVGAFEGRSLIWMIENVLTHPTSTATAVDPFMEEYEATYDANIVASGASKRVTKIKELSGTALRKLPLESFDVIYIDGSHTADDVLSDAVLAWGLLRRGGLVIFDDYTWPGRPDGDALPPELLPKIAIDAFVTAYRSEIELVSKGAQVMLRKLDNPCRPKDYCSPVGQYMYFWREFELRDAAGKVVTLSTEERVLVEQLAKAKRPGEVAIRIDRKLRESPLFVELESRLALDLRPRRALETAAP